MNKEALLENLKKLYWGIYNSKNKEIELKILVKENSYTADIYWLDEKPSILDKLRGE